MRHNRIYPSEKELGQEIIPNQRNNDDYQITVFFSKLLKKGECGGR